MEWLPGLMFGAGIASGVHCVGMCGGIVSAFDGRRTIPIVPVRAASDWARRLAFNAGRISSYAAAGAAAGTLGAAAFAAAAGSVQGALSLAINVMLVLVGLHLAGLDRWLGRLEALGAPLWRRLQPLAAVLLSGRTLARAYGAGVVWGWLPCAMVYAAITVAAFSGSTSGGALAMTAFGFGTLPFLLAAGWLAGRLRAWRLLAGSLVLGFGAYGLAHAGGLAENVRRALLCL